MGELYKLTFPNGKAYIGITTKTARHRFGAHASNAKAGVRRSALYAAWRKYGPPIMEVLGKFDGDDLYEAERLAILEHGTHHPNGYNLTSGGEISPMLFPEPAAKMRATKARNGTLGLVTPEAAAKISAALKGRVIGGRKRHTDEWKAAASERMRGNKHAAGVVISAEEREKRRQRMLGRKFPERQGIPLPAETKRKMAIAQKARRLREKEEKEQP